MSIPSFEELAKVYDEYIVSEDTIHILKEKHNSYISGFNIFNKLVIKTYTTKMYTLINTFLQNKDTLQNYINYFPIDTPPENLNILNIFKSINYDFLNQQGLIDETGITGAKKGSVDIKTIYDTVVYPILESSANNIQGRSDALTFFRNHMAMYFLRFNNLLYTSPKMTSLIRCFRGEKNRGNVFFNGSETELYLKGIISSSLSKDIALQFINQTRPDRSVFLELFLHPTCNYLFIESISDNPEEQEIVISPFTKFIVIRNSELEGGLQAYSLYGLPSKDQVLEPIDVTNEMLALNKNENLSGGFNRTRRAGRRGSPIYKAKVAITGRKAIFSNRTPFENRMSEPIQFNQKRLTKDDLATVEKNKICIQ
jgi:hypothetical protein